MEIERTWSERQTISCEYCSEALLGSRYGIDFQESKMWQNRVQAMWQYHRQARACAYASRETGILYNHRVNNNSWQAAGVCVCFLSNG